MSRRPADTSGVATESGLVLPEGVLPVSGAHTFPPFPGVYEPGVPVALSAIGLTADEAKALIAEYDLPLKEAKAEVQAEPVTPSPAAPAAPPPSAHGKPPAADPEGDE